MAQLSLRDDFSVLKIDRFLGLNENPDGDTTLKTGEMSTMRNFCITQDGHLQIRPGTETKIELYEALCDLGGVPPDKEDTEFYGVWRGEVAGAVHTLIAYAGHIWDVDVENGTATNKGSSAQAATTFFGFGGKVYALDGTNYLAWDGGALTSFASVDGYVPIVQTATTPAGAGTLLEAVNRLTNKRRVQFSPDGTAVTFQLPEKNITAVTSVTDTGTARTDYSVDAANGTVTFNAAPASGTNTLMITYSAGPGARSEVTAMRFSELYNGSQDTRVFLYGDGSNKTIYSGIEYVSGAPSAEYFPDLAEVAVGESNTPVTALVRHYSRLLAFKPNSAWSIRYGAISLEDGTTTAAFYVQPVNRQNGNEAPGQVKLIQNNPLTLDVGNIYQWKSGSRYTADITSSETNATRVSDRVVNTIRAFDVSQVRTANIKHSHEFWFMYGSQALILNYSNDTWYLYGDLPAVDVFEVENDLYGVSAHGDVVQFSREYRSDDGAPIDCYAATGAMDFGRDWMTKYSPHFFVAMQPETNARVTVTIETNRSSDFPEKVVAYSLATFEHADFAHWSFATNRKPQVKRVRIRARKSTFYRIIYKSNSASSTATVIETDVRLRYCAAVR